MGPREKQYPRETTIGSRLVILVVVITWSPDKHVPQNSSLPSPLRYVDVMRQTDSDNAAEQTINVFGNIDDALMVLDCWVGRTRFKRVRTRSPEFYKFVHGHLSNIQRTTMSDTILPEAWVTMSMKEKQHKIEHWEGTNPNYKQFVVTDACSRFLQVSSITLQAGETRCCLFIGK